MKTSNSDKDKVIYIDGYKIFYENNELYVNSVSNKKFKTPASIVLATGSVHRFFKKHYYTEYGKIFVGNKIIDEKVPLSIIDKIKNMLC